MSEQPASPPPEESPFWRALGITPEFDDEAKAPAVDVEKLVRYHRGELGETESHEVRLLAGRFRSWYMAFCESAGDRRPAGN
ncbi:MAG: hypothetical protein ACKVP0_14515 [Pirellulaceae bacterium]